MHNLPDPPEDSNPQRGAVVVLGGNPKEEEPIEIPLKAPIQFFISNRCARPIHFDSDRDITVSLSPIGQVDWARCFKLGWDTKTRDNKSWKGEPASLQPGQIAEVTVRITPIVETIGERGQSFRFEGTTGTGFITIEVRFVHTEGERDMVRRTFPCTILPPKS